jgi:hypothetical protein
VEGAFSIAAWVNRREFGNTDIGDSATYRLPPNDKEEEIPPPTSKELKLAVLKLKNNKVSGPDGLLKIDEIIRRFWRLIGKLWKEEIFPSQWEEGDRMMCENYRSISLLKVFSGMLLQRL